jgi:hypothetical protein
MASTKRQPLIRKTGLRVNGDRCVILGQDFLFGKTFTATARSMPRNCFASA